MKNKIVEKVSEIIKLKKEKEEFFEKRKERKSYYQIDAERSRLADNCRRNRTR